MYKLALPLPNPDIHEAIAEKLDLKPSKVFFGINLVRQKLKLPKLDFPKRRLALSPDQLSAIETLYEPYLPLPPIGIHKIIAKQLRMDEWRVHVGIGLVRKNRNMPRWNEGREDLPETMRQSLAEKAAREEAEAKAKEVEAKAKEAETAQQAAQTSETAAPQADAGQQPSPTPVAEAPPAEAAPEPPAEAAAVPVADAPPVKRPRGRPKKVVPPVAAEAPPAQAVAPDPSATEEA